MEGSSPQENSPVPSSTPQPCVVSKMLFLKEATFLLLPPPPHKVLPFRQHLGPILSKSPTTYAVLSKEHVLKPGVGRSGCKGLLGVRELEFLYPMASLHCSNGFAWMWASTLVKGNKVHTDATMTCPSLSCSASLLTPPPATIHPGTPSNFKKRLCNHF